MDYEFIRDIMGQCAAKFSMEQEAFGAWLTEDLGDKQADIQRLLDAITQLRQKRRWDFEYQGCEFIVQADRHRVSVSANGLSEATDYEHDDFDEGYQNDSSELQAECGLEDFESILSAWQVFTLQGQDARDV